MQSNVVRSNNQTQWELSLQVTGQEGEKSNQVIVFFYTAALQSKLILQSRWFVAVSLIALCANPDCVPASACAWLISPVNRFFKGEGAGLEKKTVERSSARREGGAACTWDIDPIPRLEKRKCGVCTLANRLGCTSHPDTLPPSLLATNQSPICVRGTLGEGPRCWSDN